MIEHEKQHIQQGHTFDVLILEIIAVCQWFNPFFWMFRRALRENHEFLADQAVISQGTVPSTYKQILLSQYVGGQIIIANNFNYSLIKTRIKMMSKIKSRKIANVKILIGIVLAVSLVAVFACEQKTSAKTETGTNEKSVTILYEGHTMQISGDSIGIEKIRQLIAKSEIPQKEEPLKNTANFVPEVGEVFMVVEQMPEFQGGQTALRDFLAKSVKYPSEAVKKGIQGKVYVSFVVAADGTVRNSKVIRGVNEQLDAEALRVINGMPKWTPGKQSGKEVAVQFTVPINFVLQ
jgi:TonB family protein